MKILVTGSEGQVGFELRRSLAPLGEVIALDRRACDLSNPDQLRSVIQSVAPQVIVNPAAWTAVDLAEEQPQAARVVNATAPGIIGTVARDLGALVVHYSTDYVFDGSGTEPYREDDPTHPQSVYGRTKLEGERALQDSGAACLVFRSSWIFGFHGRNFLKTMLKLARERDALKVVDDQVGAPTSAALIADVTAQIIGQRSRERPSEGPVGIYHLAAQGSASWYDYACHLIDSARRMGVRLQVREDAIHPVSSAEFPRPAKRPANSRLDTTRLENRFGLKMPPWQDGVERVLQQIIRECNDA